MLGDNYEQARSNLFKAELSLVILWIELWHSLGDLGADCYSGDYPISIVVAIGDDRSQPCRSGVNSIRLRQRTSPGFLEAPHGFQTDWHWVVCCDRVYLSRDLGRGSSYQ